MEKGNEIPSLSDRSIRLIVVVALWSAALLAPLRVMSRGFVPPDDALRHCARAVSGRPWQDILVMNPIFTVDSHPGWHAILESLRGATGWGTEGLVVFSVVALACAFVVIPSFFYPPMELWLASLTAVCVISPIFTWRLLLGRPFVLTMAGVCAWLIVFRGGVARPSWRCAAGLAALTALATWAHGLWFLWALVALSIAATSGRRQTLLAASLMVIGAILGLCATGHPLSYAVQTVRHAAMAFQSPGGPSALAYEFQPMGAEQTAPLAVAAALAFLKAGGEPVMMFIRQPAFVLAGAGWSLGWISGRFWYDWGLPALAVWFALVFERLAQRAGVTRLGRLGITGAAALLFWLVVSSDVDSRWSRYSRPAALDAKNPAHSAWLPAPGGVLYSHDMKVFYDTFYTNPTGQWRYVLGFEPAWMRPEDLAVFREIHRTQSFAAFTPWVRKMTDLDRLAIRHESDTPPPIPELEWGHPIPGLWVGRRK